jgi:putative heme-binding domain-containing protein
MQAHLRVGISRLLTLLLALCPATLSAAPPVVPTEPLAPELQQQKFHLPPGFEIQLIVAEPDIGQPMNLSFDARGRLWITHSLEYPYPVTEGQPGRDALTVVEGIGLDGKPRKVTKFVDELNIPIGQTPIGDGRSAIVYSIPNIYRCLDTNNDGIADTRTLLYGKFGYDDTHGMASSFTRWIDGWVYGCHGFRNTSEVKSGDGHSFTMNSGNTYRFRADGSRIEQFTWGQVNPFGMTFDALGNMYTSDCHSKPIFMLLRGAYYPSFGKPHDGLGFGPEMINHDHGSTGICGPAYYAADQFPAEYRDNVFMCNPVNCSVHRDKLKPFGSTLLCDTQPDFVTCDDQWFRPVHLQVGPDGALYIADFYNCIIGHYEVPLNHPRRDRTHGRVWRVVYKGTSGDPRPVPPLPDLTQMNVDELVSLLGHANLSLRTMTTNYLVDRSSSGGQQVEVVRAVNAAIAKPPSPELLSHGMWVLERLGALDDARLLQLAGDSSELVRVHVLKLLAERRQWDATKFTSVRAALQDDNAFVRRAAADALGQHPAVENVPALLALLESTDKQDTHLVHMTRIALRNQLRDEETLAALPSSSFSEQQSRTLAELALAAKSAASAEFVVRHLDQYDETGPKLVAYLEYAAQYVTERNLQQLTQVVRKRLAGDAQAQYEQLAAIQTGLERRGVRDNPHVTDWARELAAKLLDTPADNIATWTSLPHPDATAPGDPWVRQPRVSSDGNRDAQFWSSLPRGEQLTGILRSSPFEISATLTFFVAGHNGPTGQPEQAKNFIRLRDAATNALLAEAKPPRNDTAQRLQWKLDQYKGRRGYLELIDGNTEPGYAWLAVGRFSLSQLNSDQLHPQQAALELIARFRLTNYRPRVTELVSAASVEPAVRKSAAQTLLAFSPDSRLATLLIMAGASDTPATLTEHIYQLVAAPKSDAVQKALEEAMNHAPRDVQLQLAETLAGDRAGGNALLQLVSSGKASPRLLTRPSVRQKLDATKPDDYERQLAALTANLPSEDEALLKLIDERQRAFSPTAASAERGAAVYEKNCAACHKLAGKGAMIGPQLDGIAARGVARLVEDILDPNRNVDPAFRTTTLLMNDGKVITGLMRRTEGATLVLADSKGQEFTIATAEIDQRTHSTLSLMPAKFGEVIVPEDFQALLVHLLTQQVSAASQ